MEKGWVGCVCSLIDCVVWWDDTLLFITFMVSYSFGNFPSAISRSELSLEHLFSNKMPPVEERE